MLSVSDRKIGFKVNSGEAKMDRNLTLQALRIHKMADSLVVLVLLEE